VNGSTPLDLSLAHTYSNVVWHEHLGFQTDVAINGLECNCINDETEVWDKYVQMDLGSSELSRARGVHNDFEKAGYKIKRTAGLKAQ